MPKKKQPEGSRHPVNNPNVMGLRPEVLEQPITEDETAYLAMHIARLTQPG